MYHKFGEVTMSVIKPLHDNVVVEAIEETVSLGGIVIPDTADKERPQQGVVFACGPGKSVDGKLVDVTVKPGNKILFGKYAGTEIKLDGKRYLVMKESDILAILS